MSNILFEDALKAYNADIESAVARNDGTTLCKLLRFADERTIMASIEFYRTGEPLPGALPAPWHQLPDLVRANFLTAGAICVHNWDEASRQLNHALHIHLDILSSDSFWSIPLLSQLCADARVIAQEADKQLGRRYHKPRYTNKVADLLKRALTIVHGGQRTIEDGSESVVTLAVLNQLLKLYFYTNELNQCSSIIGLTRDKAFSFEKFPTEQQVIFKYYEGRLAFYNNRYSEAIKAFSYAMAHIPPSGTVQRRRVLLFMIPAKIMTGSLPSNNTLEVFDMYWFQPVVHAIRSGDVGMFDSALQKHIEFFVRSGIYLTLQKMLRFVYRALIRKLVLLTGSNRVRLDDVIAALRAAKTTMDRTQVECTLANLIHLNIISGYVAPKVGVLLIRDLVNPVDGSRIAMNPLPTQAAKTN